MKQLIVICEGFGAALLMLWRTAQHVHTLPRQLPRFIDQCYVIGYTTMPIVTILSFFIGGVLALQAGYSMQNFGTQQF